KCKPGSPCAYPPLPPPPPGPPPPPPPPPPCSYPPGSTVCVLNSCIEKACVCNCAGDSPGMNCTRACIQCATDNGAPRTWDTEAFCKNNCNLTPNESDRLNCCIQSDYNSGGCNCSVPFCSTPPMSTNPDNTTCTGKRIP